MISLIKEYAGDVEGQHSESASGGSLLVDPQDVATSMTIRLMEHRLLVPGMSHRICIDSVPLLVLEPKVYKRTLLFSKDGIKPWMRRSYVWHLDPSGQIMVVTYRPPLIRRAIALRGENVRMMFVDIDNWLHNRQGACACPNLIECNAREKAQMLMDEWSYAHQSLPDWI